MRVSISLARLKKKAHALFMNKTAIDNITNRQIRSLSNEAAEAGDLDMVAICEKALVGDQDARRECVKVVNAAEANER